MSEAVIEQTEGTTEDLPQVPESPYGRFIAINEARIARAQSSLSKRKQAFLDVLPMLFHLNNSALPGYISDTTPVGISDYVPSGKSIMEANRIARTTSLDRLTSKSMDLLGLYFMGSPGTIAYNGQSDFDIWLFINPDLSDERLKELEQKVKLIEEWAAGSSIEVHFFIVNSDKFRSGETLPLSNESSGSSQHGLLLDEFYRSSILIAGLPLTWWLVPPEFEQSYENYLNSQRHVRVTDQPPIDQCIDLGPLTEIAPDEFFGAAIWQLNKSIKSPYKSVLKLLLMEVYADDLSGISLISYQFKKRVYDSIIDISLLDPWMLMYEQVKDYLIAKGDDLRLNVLNRSFYLKINEAPDQREPTTRRLEDWKQKMIDQLLDSWGWDEEQISYLDSRYKWKLETVMREHTDLVNVLTSSFRNLSNFAKQHSDNSKITQSDLELLNHRLFSAFERKPNKVELVNFGISPNMRESIVTLHLLESSHETSWGLDEASSPTSWVLYRGVILQKDIGDSTHLKRTSSLIEMLAWCYFNQVLDKNSKVLLNGIADQKVSQQEIKVILKSFAEQFPHEQKLDQAAQSDGASIIACSVFVNTGIEPNLSGSSPNDTILFSQRINALSYGGRYQNLIRTCDLIFITSLGEIFIKYYSGDDALVDCISEYISWSPPSKKKTPTNLNTYCYSPFYGSQIKKTLSIFFQDIIERFYKQQSESNGRYLLEIADGYNSIEINNDQVSNKKLNNRMALVNYLSKPRVDFSQLYFGPYACSDTVLPTIYSINNPESIQIFFQLTGDTAKIYILDEKGSLFIQENKFINKHSLFANFKIFSDAVIDRIVNNDLSNLLHKKECRTEMYLVTKDLYDQVPTFVLEPIKSTTDKKNSFLKLQVLCDRDETNTEQYTIYCKDDEFSSIEFGEELFEEVSINIMTHRGSNQTYPVYITDIDLSQSIISYSGNNQFQSLHFFRYKKHIESKLTNALAQVYSVS